MKDGLTTLARIEELISTIQEQKNGLINHLGDAVRQWSTIARNLAVTENKDCLNHFVHLGGIFFLNEWLQEAQKQSSDTSDGSVEECVCLLLGALQKLSLNKEKALSSGIGFTVEQLFCHSNKNIIEKAKILLNDWAILGDDGVKCQDLKKSDPCCDDGMKCDLSTIEAKAFDASSSRQASGKVSCSLESEKQVSIHLNDDVRYINEEINMVKGMKVSISNQHTPKTISSLVDADGKSGENASFIEESSVCPMEGITHTSINVDDKPESSQKTALDGAIGMEIEKDNVAVSCMSNQKEVCIVSSSLGLSSSSPNALESVNNLDSKDFAAKKSAEVHNVQFKERESSTENISEPQGQQIVDTVECGLSEFSEIKNEHKSETTYFGTDHLGIALKEKCSTDLKVRKRAKSRKPSSSFKAKTRTGVFDDKRSHIGLEYEDDALEFAVQVAKEAKREVADREQCSSSHEESSEDEIMESESEDSEKEKYEEHDQSISASKSSHSNDSSNENTARENSDIDRDKDHVQELESPKVMSVIQESEGCADKMKCVFDLNVAPALNHDSNLSVPISSVSALKGASSSAMSTLNLEEEQGATTSHLHPMPLKTVPDGETMLPNNNKKFNLFSIDLNISEGEEDVHLNQVVEKQLPVSSDLPSRECSVEIISRKSERLNLDLNSFGDDETFPIPPTSHWRSHLHENEIFGSTSSSSFSTRQPGMREIDLNDNLFKSSFKDEKSQDTSKPEDPVITIMGSRMTVERKESKLEPICQTQNHLPFMVNRLVNLESVGIRPSLAYSHTPSAGYGRNELTLGASALSLSPALYSPGTFPYTVDSRRSTAIPQIFGSSTGMQNSLSYRPPPPFLVSAAGVPPGLNSIGSFQPDFDLNSGPLSLGSGSGSGSKEMVSPLTAAGSSLSLKRKEPDCERGESYPFGYKQMTLWH